MVKFKSLLTMQVMSWKFTAKQFRFPNYLNMCIRHRDIHAGVNTLTQFITYYIFWIDCLQKILFYGFSASLAIQTDEQAILRIYLMGMRKFLIQLCSFSLQHETQESVVEV